MDSIRIKDRQTWKWYSNGEGGDAIIFLQELCGKDFRGAAVTNGYTIRSLPVAWADVIIAGTRLRYNAFYDGEKSVA